VILLSKERPHSVNVYGKQWCVLLPQRFQSRTYILVLIDHVGHTM